LRQSLRLSLPDVKIFKKPAALFFIDLFLVPLLKAKIYSPAKTLDFS